MNRNDSDWIRFVPGYPAYCVTRWGQVWSLKRRVGLESGRGTRTIVGNTLRRLEATVGSNGYRKVCLQTKPRKYFNVHALVLEAFRGPRPPGMQARHLNGDPADNNIVNLRWGTPVENNADSERHGTRIRGIKHPNVKFTTSQVREMRELARKGIRNVDIAARFGVRPSTTHNIIRKKTWKLL